MIKVSNLKFSYNKNRNSFLFPDFQLNNGESLLITGKSGVGKTTFLHLLSGLLRPTSGTILIDDTNICELSESKLDKFRGQHIGIVFQKNHAIQSLTVFENLKSRLFFVNSKQSNDEINQILTNLDLTAFKNKKINQLSEGQLQRLGIALSVIHSPKLILADEPTSSLDDENCNLAIKTLKSQALKNQAALVVITHDQRVKSHFKRIIEL